MISVVTGTDVNVLFRFFSHVFLTTHCVTFLLAPARHNGGKSRQLSSARREQQLGGLFTLSTGRAMVEAAST